MSAQTVIATTTRATPAFAQLVVQPSTTSVYKPPESEIAKRLHDSLEVLDNNLGQVTAYPRAPSVITDFWPVPIIGGLAVSGVMHLFGLDGVGWATLVGGAASALTLAVHPFVRRQAKANSTPLLDDEAREAVQRLEHAKTDFAPTEGGRFEAQELDAALAARARHWLEVCKNKGVTDRHLLGILEDFVKRDTPLSDDEQGKLTLTLKVIEAFKQWDGYSHVLKLFQSLSDDEKRAIAPFIRERAFTADGPVQRSNRRESAIDLHAALEAVCPSLPAFEIKTGQALLGGVKPNIIDTLENVAEFEALFAKGTHQGFESTMPAFAYAKSDKRTAIERVLIGTMAARVLQQEPRAYEDYRFRERHALAELVAIARAQPDEARARGRVITENLEGSGMTLSQNIRVLKLREA